MEGFRTYIAKCYRGRNDFLDGDEYCYRGPYQLNGGNLVIDNDETFEEFKPHLFILACDESNYVVFNNIKIDHFKFEHSNIIAEFNDLTVDTETFEKLKLKEVYFKNCRIDDLSNITASRFKFENCDINVLPSIFECSHCQIYLQGKIQGTSLTFTECDMEKIDEIKGSSVQICGGKISNLKRIASKYIDFCGVKNQILNGLAVGFTQPFSFEDCDYVNVCDVSGCIFNPFTAIDVNVIDVNNSIFSIDTKNIYIENVNHVQFKKLNHEYLRFSQKHKANYIIGEESEQSLFTKICYRLSLW